MARSIIRPLMALGILILAATGVHAQETGKDAIRQSVESKRFVFKPQSAQPLSGPSRQLTTDWDMTVLNDSLIAYLPYFGRAFTPVNPSSGGIN
ncbi:MAG TPA: DUF4251 domain-containing protein, partial [Flavisolibacter sp.]|nr:DUF4251 domain-containing protein [Flavisolibacter sp.]